MSPDPRADLAESMVPLACDLACRVRDGDADGIARLTESRGWDTETAALVVVLAAMVPDTSPVGDLLGWSDGLESVLAWRQQQLPLIPPGRPVTEACGTYAAWCRHKRRGEEVDGACYLAWQKYRAERRVARKERAQEAATGEQAA